MSKRAGGIRSRPVTLVLMVIGLVLWTGCGQYHGVHGGSADLAPGQDAQALTSPNGENGPPSVTIKTTIVIIKTVRRGSGAPGSRGVIPGLGPNPFLLCPVQGTGFFADDFGAPRFAGGFHLHAGNDIVATTGTPIVAPFDGTAVAAPNLLGGNGVDVMGSQGYVYNAHLDAYANLGVVKAGQVVGYVGTTGDAMGGTPHDHFEWHPNVIPVHPHVSPYGVSVVGNAIDPYPYLVQVCTPGS